MYDYYKLRLSSLSDTLFNVVEGLPYLTYQYANLTTFTNLSNNYDSFEINNTSNLSYINLDIDNLTSNLSILRK
jgi:hypothetical protein